jgi:hypothetical protein
MTARDLFGLALRLLALFLCFWGLWYLVAGFVYLPAMIEGFTGEGPSSYASVHYAAYGLPAVIVALLMLRFANQIVYFTYRS